MVLKSLLQETNYELTTRRANKNSKINISTGNSSESLLIDESEDKEEHLSIASPHLTNKSCPKINACNREFVQA